MSILSNQVVHTPLLARSLRRRGEVVEGGLAGLVTALEDLGRPENPVEPVGDNQAREGCSKGQTSCYGVRGLARIGDDVAPPLP